MTEVYFYVLQQETAQHRLLFACKLVNRALAEKRQVYLHTSNEIEAKTLDELLWSYEPTSFIPHSLLGKQKGEPVTIGWGDDPGDNRDFMINLDLKVPSFIGRFKRVGEIVVQDQACRTAMRDSYRYYRERGYPLKNHPIP